MLRKLSHTLALAVACCTPSPLPAAPAPAPCRALSLDEALDASGAIPGHRLDSAHLRAFLALAVENDAPPLAMPDGVMVMAPRGAPLLVLLTRGPCIVGAFEIERPAAWQALRRSIGPLA